MYSNNGTYHTKYFSRYINNLYNITISATELNSIEIILEGVTALVTVP